MVPPLSSHPGERGPARFWVALASVGLAVALVANGLADGGLRLDRPGANDAAAACVPALLLLAAWAVAGTPPAATGGGTGRRGWRIAALAVLVPAAALTAIAACLGAAEGARVTQVLPLPPAEEWAVAYVLPGPAFGRWQAVVYQERPVAPGLHRAWQLWSRWDASDARLTRAGPDSLRIAVPAFPDRVPAETVEVALRRRASGRR